MAEKLSPSEELAKVQLEIARVQLEHQTQSLELVKRQVQDHKDAEADRERVAKARTSIIEANDHDKARLQRICRHKTGGRNRDGFYNGDGEHGYCVNKQQLPTGEWYGLCLRCQKEWHHPSWLVRIEYLVTGRVSMTRAQYTKMEEDFEEAMGWSAKDLQPTEASLFRIPRLDQINVDQLEFAK